MFRAAGRTLTVGEVRQEIADLDPMTPFGVEFGEHAGLDASPIQVVLTQPIEQFGDLQECLDWLDEVCGDDDDTIPVAKLLDALIRFGLRAKL
jgi:hypothetical protein